MKRCLTDGQAVIRGHWFEDADEQHRTNRCVSQVALQTIMHKALWSDPRLIHIALLDEDSEANQMVCELVLEQMRMRTAPLHLLVRIEGNRLRQTWGEETRYRAQQHGINMQCFSLIALQARTLLRERGLDRLWHPSSQALRILIIGSGDSAEELLVQIARLAHIRQMPILRCWWLTSDPELHIEHFLTHYSGLSDRLQLTGIRAEASMSATTAAILEHTAQHSLRPDPGLNAVILLGHSRAGDLQAQALDLEQSLLRWGRQPPPMYRLGESIPHTLSNHLHHDLTATETVDISQLMDAGLAMLLDALPQAIHEDYLKKSLERGERLGSRPALQPWALLPHDFADDNRTVVDHYWIKARDLDANIRTEPGLNQADRPSDFVMDASEIEALAIVEHERWCATRLSLGWRYAPQRDDEQRLHHNLVPWSELSETDRDKDRDIVRQFPTNLAYHGYKLQRLRRVKLDTTTETPPPDPTVLWIISLETQTHYQMATELIAQGDAVELHIRHNLVHWTQGDSVTARSILRRAWRVVGYDTPHNLGQDKLVSASDYRGPKNG